MSSEPQISSHQTLIRHGTLINAQMSTSYNKKEYLNWDFYTHTLLYEDIWQDLLTFQLLPISKIGDKQVKFNLSRLVAYIKHYRQCDSHFVFLRYYLS